MRGSGGRRREGEEGRRDYLICGCDGAGVDVVVATPGKLLQLCEGGELTLSSLSYFAVDEADRFLQGTMEEDLRKVCLCLCAEENKALFHFSSILCRSSQLPPAASDQDRPFSSPQHCRTIWIGWRDQLFSTL